MFYLCTNAIPYLKCVLWKYHFVNYHGNSYGAIFGYYNIWIPYLNTFMLNVLWGIPHQHYILFDIQDSNLM